MDPHLLSYYEAIERASADMLTAARAGRWDDVVKLEGACVLLISQLKNASLRKEEHPDAVVVDDIPGHGIAPSQHGPRAASGQSKAEHAPGTLPGSAQHSEAAQMKSRIMRRILVNDAEIRQLAEPWLQDLDDTLAGRRQLMH